VGKQTGLIGGTEAYTNSYNNPTTLLILNKRIDYMYCGQVSKQNLSICVHQFTLHLPTLVHNSLFINNTYVKLCIKVCK